MRRHFSRWSVPANVILLATHGSDAIPDIFRGKLHPDFDRRLQKNFSDFGTARLLELFDQGRVITPQYGRIAGDPNRDLTATDFLRHEDFNGNQLWNNDFKAEIEKKGSKWRKKAAEISVFPYYEKIFQTIEKLCQDPLNEGRPLIMLDIHDTGNRLLAPKKSHDQARGKTSDFTMPKMILSNVCGKTCPDLVLRELRAEFSDELEIFDQDIRLNEHFQGGFVTRWFGGAETNPRLEKLLAQYGRTVADLWVIQVEFDRALYLDESEQVIQASIGFVRRALRRSITTLATLNPEKIRGKICLS